MLRRIAVLLSAALAAGPAIAQGNEQFCAEKGNGTSQPFAFALGSNDRLPLSSFETQSVGNARQVSVEVCLPIDVPVGSRRIGAANFRIRVVRSVENKTATSGRVTLGSDTDEFKSEQLRVQRAAKRNDVLPDVGIGLYQRYHGCAGDQGGPLKTLFHGRVNDDRTDREDVKSKFLFSNDVSADCSVFSQGVAFLSSAPTVGPTIGFASGRMSNDIADIIFRRSILRRYVFEPGPKPAVRFVTYEFTHLPADSCFAVYAVDVFDASWGSEPIGFGCLD